MRLDELIEKLKIVRGSHEGTLPVILCTQGGSGSVDAVVVELDHITQRTEVRLVEKP